MPKIPVYDAGQVQTQSAPAVYQQSSANADDFGAAQGRALQQVGQDIRNFSGTMFRRAQQIKTENDAAKVIEADAALAEWENESLHNPETGYYAQRGKNALGGTKRLREEFQKTVGDLEGKLDNDEQKQTFRKMLSSRSRAVMSGAARHEAQERKGWIQNVTDSAVTASVNGAINNYTDPQIIDSHLTRGQTYIRSTGKTMGDSADQITLRIQQMRSDAHQGVIERLLISSPGQAKAYYDQHKGEITGADHAATKKRIKGHEDKAAAQAFSDKIWQDGGELDVMLKKARVIKDPAVRDTVVSRLKARRNEAKAIKDDKEKDVVQQTWTSIDQALMSGSTTKAFDAIPPELPHDMREEMQSHITKQTSLRTPNQMMDGAIRSMGMKPASTQEKEAQEIALFRSRVQQEITTLEKRQGGRTATPEQFQTILDILSIKDDAWIGQKRLFQLEEEEVFSIDADDLSFAQKRTLVRTMHQTMVQQFEAKVGRKATSKEVKDITAIAPSKKQIENFVRQNAHALGRG